MTSAYHRKKEPEILRRKLLDSAIGIASEGKPGNLTLQSVAHAAGVTKGGLLHHFPNKEALAEAIFTDLLKHLDHDLDALVSNDPIKQGSFTRAYVHAVFRVDISEEVNPWTALSVSMLTDTKLCALWAEWLNERLERHKDTDDAPRLTIARYAADGIWLEDWTSPSPARPASHRAELFAHLVAMTYDEEKN